MGKIIIDIKDKTKEKLISMIKAKEKITKKEISIKEYILSAINLLDE